MPAGHKTGRNARSTGLYYFQHMPYSVPHRFQTLRKSGAGPHRRSVILIGAGMSHGSVPLPPSLLKERGASASHTLGCYGPTAQEDLYAWADRIIQHLIATGDPNPKLKLAQTLGLIKDPRWLGASATQRNSPRHRVVARFGREGLWEQIWSLNWDCVQESAFENVGIVRDGSDPRVPWPTGFRTFVTARDCATIAEENMIHIIKPHGCVRALADAADKQLAGDQAGAVKIANRFLITRSELAAIEQSDDPAQTYVYATLCNRLSGHPFITIGWSASEPYLLDYVDATVRPQLAARPLADDELNVIDLAFGRGHLRLAGCYGKTEAQAHVPVTVAGLTLDRLFLWIQSLYALERLKLAANERAADQAAIAELEAGLTQPSDTRHFEIDWVDNFLPAWVRLCWRCGLVPHYNAQYQLIPIEEIDLEARDEHVPWNLTGGPRPDLASAAMLLAALHQNGTGSAWDFDSFPGGLYRSNDSHLVVPLPAWTTASDNQLRGLNPLVDAMQAYGTQPISRISILPLSHGAPPDPDKIVILKQRLAARIKSAAFADSAKIDVVDLARI